MLLRLASAASGVTLSRIQSHTSNWLLRDDACDTWGDTLRKLGHAILKWSQYYNLLFVVPLNASSVKTLEDGRFPLLRNPLPDAAECALSREPPSDGANSESSLKILQKVRFYNTWSRSLLLEIRRFIRRPFAFRILFTVVWSCWNRRTLIRKLP